MKPNTKLFLKIFTCHCIASICLGMRSGLFEGHPHVALSNVPVVMAFFAPLVGALEGPALLISLLNPFNWPETFPLACSYWIPFIITMSIALRKPARWYRFWTGR